MNIINKILAGLVMGITVAILCFVLVDLGSPLSVAGGMRGVWAALIGFAAMIVLALTAARGRYAWGRGFLICGLLCLALPLASLAFSAIVGARIGGFSPDTTAAAGAAVGTAMFGTVMAIVSGIVGFSLGSIFLVSSYFTLRSR